MTRWTAGLIVNALAAGTAYRLGTVNRGGALTGLLLGTLVYGTTGPRGFVLLIAFFVLGTAATKLGYWRKHQAGIAQEEGGARGWPHALANAGGPALLAVGSVLLPHRELFLIGFSGALATAAGDTTSSEIGKAYGRRTVLLTSFRAVPRGTTGAVSLEGTLAGIGASFLIAMLAAAQGLVSSGMWIWVGLAGFVGFMLEGYVGAAFESRGLVNNEQVNFLNTLMGAGAAMLLGSLLR